MLAGRGCSRRLIARLQAAGLSGGAPLLTDTLVAAVWDDALGGGSAQHALAAGWLLGGSGGGGGASGGLGGHWLLSQGRVRGFFSKAADGFHHQAGSKGSNSEALSGGSSTSSGSGSCRDSDSSSGSGSGSDDSEPPASSAAPIGLPEDRQLLALGQHYGVLDPPALLHSIRKCAAPRQAGLVQHAADVVQHLRGLQLTQQQVADLLQGCPNLFSRPAEQHAAVLFSQLMRCDGDNGLSAAEAIQCFASYGKLANYRNLAFEELAAILADSKHNSRAPKSALRAEQRTVVALLRRIPSTIQLAGKPPGRMQRQSAELLQLGLQPADVARLVWDKPGLFYQNAAQQLSSIVDVLQEELELSKADDLAMIACARSWVTCSIDTLRERIRAVADPHQGVGKEAAAYLVRHSDVLNCPPIVWQRNLRIMAACGIAAPMPAIQRSFKLLAVNHAAPGFVARRLLLQHYFRHEGGAVTAAVLYLSFSSYLTAGTAEKLAQRLQYLQAHDKLHLLVLNKTVELELWREEQEAAPSHQGQQQAPPLISVRDVLNSHATFCAAAGVSEEEWDEFATARPASENPIWQWAQREAVGEVQRLEAALPSEMRQARHPQRKFSFQKRELQMAAQHR